MLNGSDPIGPKANFILGGFSPPGRSRNDSPLTLRNTVNKRLDTSQSRYFPVYNSAARMNTCWPDDSIKKVQLTRRMPAPRHVLALICALLFKEFNHPVGVDFLCENSITPGRGSLSAHLMPSRGVLTSHGASGMPYQLRPQLLHFGYYRICRWTEVRRCRNKGRIRRTITAKQKKQDTHLAKQAWCGLF